MSENTLIFFRENREFILILATLILGALEGKRRQLKRKKKAKEFEDSICSHTQTIPQPEAPKPQNESEPQ